MAVDHRQTRRARTTRSTLRVLRLVPDRDQHDVNGSDVHHPRYRVPTGPSALAPRPSAIAEPPPLADRHDGRGLNRAGFPVTVDQVLAESVGAHALGRPHVAKALVARDDPRRAERVRPAALRGNRATAVTHMDADRSDRAGPRVRRRTGARHPAGSRRSRSSTTLPRTGSPGSKSSTQRIRRSKSATTGRLAERLGLVMTAGSDFPRRALERARRRNGRRESDVRRS